MTSDDRFATSAGEIAAATRLAVRASAPPPIGDGRSLLLVALDGETYRIIARLDDSARIER